jgi:hypothetical protein
VSNVVSLAEVGRVPTADIRGWAHEWVDSIMDGEFGDVRSLVMLVENTDGEVDHVAQSTKAMDGYRLIGLLTNLARRIGEGSA